METSSSLKALSIAIAASASMLAAAMPATAQLAQPFTQQINTGQINNVLPTRLDPAPTSNFPGSLPKQGTSNPTFAEVSSPNIDVSNSGTSVQVILIDPLEQSYFNAWERTATTQLTDINIRSATQAPITQIRIRAGHPVISRLAPQTRAQTRQRALSTLPDGNYRLLLSASGVGESGAVTDGRLFTFRKLGNAITGNFDYVGSGDRACVTGTLQGNTVFGEALTNSAGINVLGSTYLGAGLSLQLSNAVNENAAVLSLDGFSLINAGTIAPPTVCQ
ncbi:MAG: hypothetical protein AAF703_19790 [Cyanobacteria bacterium P01_D01_bin.105]